MMKFEAYEVSSAQKRIYLLHRIQDLKAVYNMPLAIIINGNLDPQHLENTFKKLILRHETLRTSFVMKEEEILQKVYDNIDFKLKYTETSQIEIDQQINNFVQPFTLEEVPLWRVELVQLEKNKQLFLFDIHHIVADGQSGPVFFNDLVALYRGIELSPLEFQYVDFTIWQNDLFESEKFKKQEEYWQEKFPGEIPVLHMPFDFPIPLEEDFSGDVIQFSIQKELTRKLNQLAADSRATFYVVLLAAYNVLLSKYSGQEDIIVGTPIAGRTHPEFEKIIGMFVNTLAMRNSPVSSKSFKLFLQEVLTGTFEAFENQDYPFEVLVEQLKPERQLNRNPLFDTMFVFHDLSPQTLNISRQNSKNANTQFITYPVKNEAAKFALTLSASGLNDNTVLKVQYRTALFKKSTIERMIKSFKNILQTITSTPDLELAAIQIISQEEKKQILYDFNDTEVEYPRSKTIHELFEEQAARTPDHVALVGQSAGREAQGEDEKWCVLCAVSYAIAYRELNERTNHLARLLIERGVTFDTMVGIMVERSLEMIIGIFSILKAGGTYLPIDPDYPEERKQYMLKDSGTKILLTGQEIAGLSSPEAFNNSLKGNPSFGIWNLEFGISPQQGGYLAYIIYTSGSTGKPKGVLVDHRSLVNRLNWMQKTFPINENDTLLQKTTFTFDVSVWEIFWWAIEGARLALLMPGQEKDPQAIAEAVQKNRVTYIHFVPSMLTIFLEYIKGSNRVEKLSGLKQVIVSGEALNSSQVKLFNEILHANNGTRLANLYGPTEATIDVSYFHCSQGEKVEKVPIGKPIDNIKLFIMSKENRLQPIGVVGELCISGVGLSRGYLNRPVLTAEKFCLWRTRGAGTLLEKVPLSPEFYPRPYALGSRLYKTGDLACWLPDGNIEFLGRQDHQVKIRGFRIELGEIENQLLDHPGIKETLVISTADALGDKHLCAYIVPNRVDVTVTGLREYLAKRLPGYMIPSYFVTLNKIPLTDSGKVDRKALPEPGKRFAGTGEGYVPPGNKVEERLVRVWQEVLGIECIGITDNFFEMGGDSIKAILISARLKKQGLSLNIKDLFLNPVIRKLGRCITAIDRSIHQGVVEGVVTLTPIQRWFFDNHSTHGSHFNQAVMLYRREGFEEETLKKVISKIVEHHDALRMVYRLGEPPGTGNVIQHNRGIEGKLFDLEIIDFKEKQTNENHEKRNIKKEIQQAANRIQRSIDLKTGPLLKLGLFKTVKGDHLLMVIHHLVVDGISWRILLEDLGIGYNQLQQGHQVKFQDKTDSFKYWAQRLKEYAAHMANPGNQNLAKEVAYWKNIEIEAETIPGLPRDHEIDRQKKKNKYTETVSMDLNPKETELLLKKVNWAYNTEINDILLTAMGLALKEWAGVEKVLIDLEGHGREPIIEDVDISRTVGWFTTLYPVILDMKGSGDLAHTIKSVKETLRRIPNKGIGYGIIRYLTPVEKKEGHGFKLKPGISFNYLGQFGQESTGNTQPGRNTLPGKTNHAGFIKTSPLSPGQSFGPQLDTIYAIGINGIIKGKRLRISFTYNRYEYDRENIGKLSQRYQANLLKIIEHCRTREEKELTPSDLGNHHITLEEFANIKDHVANNIDENLEIKLIYPLSPMQSGMLYHWLKDKKSHAYFEQVAYALEELIQRTLLESSFNTLLERYDIFRTNFVYEELAEPLQMAFKKRNARLYYEDIHHLDKDKQKVYLDRFKRKDREKGFDVTRDILMRLALFKTGESSCYIVWSFHHILMDGWCIPIIFSQLIYIYKCLRYGRPLQLEEAVPYIHYIKWLEKQDKGEALRYWEKYLEGYDQTAGLPGPAGMVKAREDRYQPEEYHLFIDEALTIGLNRAAAETYVTINVVFQAIWGILLQGYNNCGDVVYGVVVSGRSAEITGIETMIGLFINSIPVRIKGREDQEFSQLSRAVQESSTASKPYEFVSLAEVQGTSQLKGNLIDHLMAFENYPTYREGKNKGKGQQSTTNVKSLGIHEQSNYNFNIIIGPRKNFIIKFLYNGFVYEEDFIQRVGLHLKHMIKQVVDRPGILIKEIEITTAEEKRQILLDFNDTQTGYPANKTIHELFEHQVEKTPAGTAVIFECPGKGSSSSTSTLGKVTYSQLNEQANHLAWRLRAKGVTANGIVGIMLERSLEMIVGILGILKAGGAYLPIDLELPQRRKKSIADDCHISIVLTRDDIIESLSFSSNPALKIKNINHSTDLAYLMYTSGSTGIPKCVMVEHKNVIRLVKNTNYLELGENDKTLQIGKLDFDASTFEIWGSLLNGGKLYLFSKDRILSPVELKNIITEHNINIMLMTTAMFNQMVEQDINIFHGPETLMVGGEALSPYHINLVRNKFKGVKVINVYGPTENATFSSTYLIERDHQESIPIGKPIANSTVYIVDRFHHLQPVGVVGELVVGGDGVARGYLNNPELTAQKFQIPNKSGYHWSLRSHMSYILYKTGDLARWLPDGNIEFSGRIDHLVKIRGFRIEPGEIENHLVKHKGIKEAVVLAKEDKDGNKFLCAYIAVNSRKQEDVSWEEYGTPTSMELREYLSQTLPVYMIPSYFVHLEKIPLTKIGKVDRKALPEPGIKTPGKCSTPASPVEKKLLGVWESVIGIKSIGVNDNFFMIGGDSIKAIQVSALMTKEGYKVEMRHLFLHPTISELAPLVKSLDKHQAVDQSVITGTIPLTPIQKAFFQNRQTESHHFNQAVMLYSQEGFEEEAIRAVFSKIQEHHDVLRITFKEENARVVQTNRGIDFPLSLQVYDLRNQAGAPGTLEIKANEIQASINLETGPLMKLGLFRLDNGDHLLIVIHHLVIDGVSWRILFEDIERLYNQYKNGKELLLPLKTDSFKLWSERLSGYANSKLFLKEKKYWARLLSKTTPQIKKDFDNKNNYIKDCKQLPFSLSEEETSQLLTRVNKPFGTKINDILLTALCLAIKKSYGHDKLLLALEGHGREEILEAVDISRTVGWFTSVFPVILELPINHDLTRYIKEVKESLRQIPHKGIGYGILKYLTAAEHKAGLKFHLKPQISFNYLGQIDRDVKQMSFGMSKESSGHAMSLKKQREYELDISGIIINKRLRMNILYNRNQFKHETVQTLLDHYKTELKRIISYCSACNEIQPTPSDFTYKKLSIEMVDQLTKQYQIEDICLLSPMQEAMLFYALYDQTSSAYFLQVFYHMQGDLNKFYLEKSINKLMERRDILRTAFIYEKVDRPIQILLKKREVDFYYEDISTFTSEKEKYLYISEFKERDKQRSFDLTRDVLMRVAVFQTGKNHYEFNWSSHHILMDGWSMGLIITEFFEIYNSLVENREYRLPAVKPYRTYIKWLQEQDKKESERYWKEYLHQYDQLAGIPRGNITPASGYRQECFAFRLEKEKTTRLNQLAGNNHVTLNTIIQAVWGIILGCYNDRKDVVFGVVVSGRPPAIEGVETMVGLFINTIPVRIRYEKNTPFNHLLQDIKEKAIKSEPHHYYSLAEIQAETTLKRNLLDHIFVFENYPIIRQIDGALASSENKKNKGIPPLAVSKVGGFEQATYDFNVTIHQGTQLSIELHYNQNCYDGDFVKRISTHICGVINQVLINEEITIDELILLTGLKSQYQDFPGWPNKGIPAGELKKQEDYWLKEFKGGIPLMNLPGDYVKPSTQTFASDTVGFELNSRETKALRKLVINEQSTMFNLILAIFYILLSRLSGLDDIVIGIPIPARGQKNLENITGPFLNTLALRNKPWQEKTFREFSREVSQKTLTALDNQDYPFETWVRKVAVDKDKNRGSFFHAGYSLLNIEKPDNQRSPLKIKPYPIKNNIPRFDLSLQGAGASEKLSFMFIYNSNLFKKETIHRFVKYFRQLVTVIIENQDLKLKDIKLSHDLASAKTSHVYDTRDDFGFKN